MLAVHSGKQQDVYSPSSTGAGVDSFDFSASFGFDLAFANDLNMSPAVLSFFAPDFESVLLSVLEFAEGWGVERPEVLSSDALPRRAGAEASFSFASGIAAALATGFAADFAASFVASVEVEAATGGAYFAVLLYRDISSMLFLRKYKVRVIP
jgi:hypothetical protein